MASLAGNHPFAKLRLRLRWSELTARTPGRAEFALRLAVICGLTTLITQTYQIPEAALSAYIVFFMNKPDRVTSVLMSVVLTLVITVLIGLLFLIVGKALDVPAYRVGIMALLSFSLLFLASASKLKPLASIMALILVYGLDEVGKAPEAELATRGLLYVWLMVSIPAGATILANLLIGPAPRRLAERAIALRLRAMQKLIATSDSSARLNIMAMRVQGDSAIQGLVHLTSLEKTSPREDLSALQQAARSTDVLLMLVEHLDLATDLPESWRQQAANRLGAMAAILERQGYPVDIEPLQVLQGPPPTPSAAQWIADFNAVIIGFAVASPQVVESHAKAKSGFFVPDAFSNPEHVRYAVKVTMAAMLCYLFYSLTDWPGIHTCLITCYIVALDTAGETIEKLSLRMVGALAGAAAGLAAIVWITPSVDQMSGLLALVLAGGLAGGWIAGGSPRIAYAGFQLTFAFFLCVIQGTGPAFDLTVARDRIIGILLGNALVYLIFVWVWPVSLARRIDPAISALFTQLGRIARLGTHKERVDALPKAHVAILKVGVDLEVVGYEPSSLRPPREWFRRRSALLADARTLESQLLMVNASSALDALASRVDYLAGAVHEEAPSATDPTAMGVSVGSLE